MVLGWYLKREVSFTLCEEQAVPPVRSISIWSEYSIMAKFIYDHSNRMKANSITALIGLFAKATVGTDQRLLVSREYIVSAHTLYPNTTLFINIISLLFFTSLANALQFIWFLLPANNYQLLPVKIIAPCIRRWFRLANFVAHTNSEWIQSEAKAKPKRIH